MFGLNHNPEHYKREIMIITLSTFKSVYTVPVARPIYVSILFLIVISIFSYSLVATTKFPRR